MGALIANCSILPQPIITIWVQLNHHFIIVSLLIKHRMMAIFLILLIIVIKLILNFKFPSVPSINFDFPAIFQPVIITQLPPIPHIIIRPDLRLALPTFSCHIRFANTD
jgi:hypothetical protein